MYPFSCNKKAFQLDAYSPHANRMCFSGHHQMSVLVVNKFEQVSSDGHQMSLAEGQGSPMSDVVGGRGRGAVQ